MNQNYDSYQHESIFDNEQMALVPVSTGIRFANFLIDTIFVYLIIIGVSIVLTLTIPAFGAYFLDESESVGSTLLDRLFSTLAYALIFVLMEGLSKGRSLGKLITGTVAVREDGAPFTWTEAFKRSFSRIVPFETISALGGHPWHDKWSQTMVVKKP